MNDRMFLGDGMAGELRCGHPNVQPNEECPLCGKTVREVGQLSASEVGDVGEVIGVMEEERKDS